MENQNQNEPENQSTMRRINEIYSRRDVQISLDIIRIATFIFVILAMFYLYKEIEAVKFLGLDPCRYCENKTGAICTLQYDAFGNQVNMPKINISCIENGDCNIG